MRHNSSSLAPLQSLELNPRVWMLCAALLLASFNAGSAAIPSTKTRASLKIPAEAVRPGGQSIVQVGLAMAPGWHAYWRNPGESGAPISIEWILPTGIRAGEIRWPLPHKIVTGGLLTYGLEGEVVLEVPLQIDASAATGAQLVQAKLKWLECSDTLCVPQSGSVGGVITVDSAGADKAEPSVPRTQPAPLDVSVDGQWISPGGTNSSRRVQISWSMPSGSDSSDFFPYESDRFSVRGPTNAPVASGGKVTWLGEIDRLEGEWPLAIRGVVVARAAGVRNSMAKEVEVTLTEGGRSGETGGIGVSVISPASPPALSTTSRGLGYYLMFAFLGGLILNIMPCVLPVISLKILGFVRQRA
ncbi:MAG: hypothetical protein FJ405_19815, partial [Verrucomicrobia bacterium]|nr:hypothetical protein [Verrucomicrobiota bacterium]